MKNKIITSVALAVTVLATVGAALAAASSEGACHGAFANENGNFGWLGPLVGTPVYHGAVGQEPGATGYNNAFGCGLSPGPQA